jgi:putative effector of murein hydrolase
MMWRKEVVEVEMRQETLGTVPCHNISFWCGRFLHSRNRMVFAVPLGTVVMVVVVGEMVAKEGYDNYVLRTRLIV